jgi:hypothetical protein
MGCFSSLEEARTMNSLIHGLTTAIDGFAAFAPSFFAGLIVLLLGYVIARVLAGVARTLLRRIGIERLMGRLGIARGYNADDGARWAGRIVFWLVMIVTIMQVARVWNLTFVAIGFAALIAYLPHVIAAAVILGVAIMLGNWVRDRLVRSRTLSGDGGLNENQVRFFPSMVRAGILAVGTFMALRELQIAPEIVNVAFTLTLGAFALAGALAFGLGGRDVAGRIAQSWYERRRELGRGIQDVGPARTV